MTHHSQNQALVVANVKGGMGKTHLSVRLAALLAEATSGKMTLIDADPNGNAEEWILSAKGASEPDGPFPWGDDYDLHVKRVADHRALVTTMETAMRIGPVIVDTPGNQDGITSRALLAATRVLIPVSADPGDINMLAPTLELVERICAPRGVPYHAVLVQANRYPAEIKNTASFLSRQRIPLLDARIPSLKEYSFQWGMRFELADNDPYRALFNEIYTEVLA